MTCSNQASFVAPLVLQTQPSHPVAELGPVVQQGGMAVAIIMSLAVLFHAMAALVRACKGS